MAHPHQHHPHHDDKRRLGIALVLIASFMVLEVIGGLLANSLALLADAGHMLTDTLALGLALIAIRLSEHPADHRHSYGRHRAQILAAFVNGLVLLALAGWIIFEAVKRVLAPAPVAGALMLVVAGVGLMVNIAAFWILHGGSRDNLNMRGAMLHVLSDMAGSAAAILAAVIILLTDWWAADPLLSVLVAVLIMRIAWKLTRRAGHVLLEGTPEHLDVPGLCHRLSQRVPGVLDVHHVHLWSLTTERLVITLHARIDASASPAAVLEAIKRCLAEDYGIHHSTIQLEPDATCIDAELRV